MWQVTNAADNNKNNNNKLELISSEEIGSLAEQQLFSDIEQVKSEPESEQNVAGAALAAPQQGNELSLLLTGSKSDSEGLKLPSLSSEQAEPSRLGLKVMFPNCNVTK